MTLARRPFCNKFYKMSSSVFPVWHFCEICVPHTTSACHTLSSPSPVSPFFTLLPPLFIISTMPEIRRPLPRPRTAICIKCAPPAASIVLVVRNQIKQKVETGLPSPLSTPPSALPLSQEAASSGASFLSAPLARLSLCYCCTFLLFIL